MKHLITRRKRKRSDSVSSGERKRIRLNQYACDSRQALRVWGCGTTWAGLPIRQGVTKYGVSRRFAETVAIEGNSPVGENDRTSRVVSQVARSP